jgi:N-acetylmuramic acid 6-phosphate etherase
MVNVQPKNSKLRARALRIVAKAAGVTGERASELLAASGDSVRAAIVMQGAGVDRASAERLLDAAGGRVSAALEKAKHG